MTPARTHHLKPLHRIAALSVIGLALMGCRDFREFAAYSHGDLNRPQPAVTQVSVVHPIPAERFDRPSRESIDAFLLRTHPKPSELVEVRYTEGDAVARRTAEATKAYLSFRRVSAVLKPLEQVDDVRVAVHRHQVTLPACPNWSEESGLGASNQPGANWGCATAMNLGLMVANPGDLVHGRDAGPGDAQAGVLAIQRYRLGQTKPLLESSTGAPSSSGDDSGGGGE